MVEQAQTKLHRAEKLLAKLEASMVPVGPSDDQETITEEERSMFRRVGLRMKPYLPVGWLSFFKPLVVCLTNLYFDGWYMRMQQVFVVFLMALLRICICIGSIENL